MASVSSRILPGSGYRYAFVQKTDVKLRGAALGHLLPANALPAPEAASAVPGQGQTVLPAAGTADSGLVGRFCHSQSVSVLGIAAAVPPPVLELPPLQVSLLSNSAMDWANASYSGLQSGLFAVQLLEL